MKVLVIGGGVSDEREVSLRSSRVIFQSIDQNIHQAQFYDWDGSENWLRSNLKNFDVVLPILHGKGGEDGQIQQLFEELNANYLGSHSAVAKQCFDKDLTRQAVQKLGYKTPSGGCMNYQQYQDSNLRNLPHVVKPIEGGSSIHTHIILDPTKIDEVQVKVSFDIYQTLLVEECIIGQEITVGYLEGKDLPVVEIIPPEGQLFDYENKYNGLTTELCPPQNISQELQKAAVDLARQMHTELGCRHLSRTDILIRDDQLYFLEINTMPGLTEQSLFPKAAAVAGLNFPELVEYFIQLASKKVY